MPTLRVRTLADGTKTYSVLFRGTTARGTYGQTSETFDTERAALAFMADCDRYGVETARRKLNALDRAGRVDVRTVADQVRIHIDALSGLTRGTRAKYERLAAGISDHPLGALPLDAVRQEDVAAWVRSLEDSGLSSKTITDRKSLLSAAFVRALDDDLMARNPARNVRVAKTARKKPPVYLTPDEFGAILAHLPQQWHPLFVTLVGTGLRIGEATALQVGDVDLARTPPTITITRNWEYTGSGEPRLGAPKTRRGERSIGIGSDVVSVVAPLLPGRRHDEWLFVVDGALATKRRAYYFWAKAVRASGVTKRPRLHDLRHTHASWMLGRNYPLSDLSVRLGHASIKVTADTYGHLTHDAQTRAAALADMGLAELLAGRVSAQIGT